jgi:hypothetical protein
VRRNRVGDRLNTTSLPSESVARTSCETSWKIGACSGKRAPSGGVVLEREHDELGKRLEHWYERTGTEPDLGEVGAGR